MKHLLPSIHHVTRGVIGGRNCALALYAIVEARTPVVEETVTKTTSPLTLEWNNHPLQNLPMQRCRRICRRKCAAYIYSSAKQRLPLELHFRETRHKSFGPAYLAKNLVEDLAVGKAVGLIRGVNQSMGLQGPGTLIFSKGVHRLSGSQ